MFTSRKDLLTLLVIREIPPALRNPSLTDAVCCNDSLRDREPSCGCAANDLQQPV